MSITWRTARTLAGFAIEQQPRTLPSIIIGSLFRGAVWRMEKPVSRTRLCRADRSNHESQKFLARAAARLQGRCAMSTFARSTNHGRAFVATCVGAAFLWALALSASPQLHQCIHADANRAEHSCAVTAIASGNCDHVTYPDLVSAPAGAVQFSKILALTPCWVQSPFLGAHIFEHAPPARG